MEAGAPLAIPISANTNILPSVVAFGEDDDVLVGMPAKRQAAAALEYGLLTAHRGSHVS